MEMDRAPEGILRQEQETKSDVIDDLKVVMDALNKFRELNNAFSLKHGSRLIGFDPMREGDHFSDVRKITNSVKLNLRKGSDYPVEATVYIDGIKLFSLHNLA